MILDSDDPHISALKALNAPVTQVAVSYLESCTLKAVIKNCVTMILARYEGSPSCALFNSMVDPSVAEGEFVR